ncbi:hypothetical protein TNCV_5018471 [Trichonephila clavipes]|nr:hypothetical protein TNCV_5018471 [Trichonephila clavipes]
MFPYLFFLRHPDDFTEGSYGYQHPLCAGFYSHMWVANNLNEEECRLVVTKTYPQCQCDWLAYSPLDAELDTAPELGSDVPAYCLQAPMEWE